MSNDNMHFIRSDIQILVIFDKDKRTHPSILYHLKKIFLQD